MVLIVQTVTAIAEAHLFAYGHAYYDFGAELNQLRVDTT